MKGARSALLFPQLAPPAALMGQLLGPLNGETPYAAALGAITGTAALARRLSAEGADRAELLEQMILTIERTAARVDQVADEIEAAARTRFATPENRP